MSRMPEMQIRRKRSSSLPAASLFQSKMGLRLLFVSDYPLARSASAVQHVLLTSPAVLYHRTGKIHGPFLGIDDLWPLSILMNSKTAKKSIRKVRAVVNAKLRFEISKSREAIENIGAVLNW